MTSAEEKERLKALEGYHILDTLPEADYDDITHLAAMICDTPIATISFIDGSRQFRKSKIGVTDSDTPREYAFCAHAILGQHNLMIVDDARNDERFKNNPYVTGEPGIVFYAGVPLLTSAGHALGTLCVIDRKPRVLNQQQQDALKRLTNQVMNLLEARRKNGLLSLAQAKAALHAQQMEDFAYVASHDLKEPLRMVYNFMHLLENNYEGNLDEKAKMYIKSAADASRRMTKLVDELLIYALAGKNERQYEAVDTEALINEIIGLYAANIDEKRGQIQFMGLPVLRSQKTGLKIVFQNLISNALKYSRKGVAPEIRIEAKEMASQWLFSVRDNGIGIEKSNLQSVFMMFRRLHNRVEYAGIGLGLAVCKKIIEQHGGIIWVDSDAGKGSTFYFTIKKLD